MINASWKSATENSVYISDLFGLRAKCLSEQFEQKELLTPAFPSYTTQHISTHSPQLRTCFFF